MTSGQAVRYFVLEALVSLGRSWKVSLLAILTIAMSLFVSGLFLVLGERLGEVVGEWEREARIVVFLREGSVVSEDLRRLAGQPEWVQSVEEISALEARSRFGAAFPGLSDLAAGGDAPPFPASIEIGLRGPAPPPQALDAWLVELRGLPEVDLIDDDRDWLARLSASIAIARGFAVALGLVLVGAASFTIAVVVRLTAHLYRDEIAILRLVGATEFMIRGPFYVEGLLQGLAGGALAVAGLYGAHHAVGRAASGGTFEAILGGAFLGPRQVLLLLAVGAAAGLLGAVVSVRAESVLRDTPAAPEWPDTAP